MQTESPTCPKNVSQAATESAAPDRRPVVEPDGDCVVVHIPMTFQKRNGRKLVVLPEGMRQPPTAESDARCPLRLALARAYRWQKMIESGEVQSAGEIARRLKLDRSYIVRTIRLAALAPDIIEAVLRGDEPSGLSLKSMRSDVPLLWQEQRALLGMPADERQPPSRGRGRLATSAASR